MLLVICADRADVDASGAAAVDTDAAQDRLPRHESLAGLEQVAALLGRRDDEPLDVAHQVFEAVGGRVRRAALLHELPLSDRVARAGEQAPPAGFAETERLGEWRVRLELGRGQHGPEEHTRAVLRRQQHQVEPERAQPGLDRSVRQG